MRASLRCWLGAATVVCLAGVSLHAQKPAPSAAASEDPVLRALSAELERSRTQLKMDNVGTPYYIEYRVSQVDLFQASASFGVLQEQSRERHRVLRAVVRIGDYKLDSYFGAGQGVSDELPLDDDELGLRHEIWLATDQAYKRAAEAFATKQSALKQLTVDEPVDDFAKEPPVQLIDPVAKLDFDPGKWTHMLESATAAFKSDPEIQSGGASLAFLATSRYFVNTEGTVTRQGATHYMITMGASEQAADGMSLDREPQYFTSRIEELPTPEKLQADAEKLVSTMKELREAPIVDEDYQGPVLFSNEAADAMFFNLVAGNVLGRRPPAGSPARTVGMYASRYNARVLPSFMSVVDDPTTTTFDGHALGGSYKVDDEGVPVAPVMVIDNGQLVNYLLGRQPIRDFPTSNGHGRVVGNGGATPLFGNLFFKADKTATFEDLKKQMLQMCRDRGLKYGYFVDTFDPRLAPRLLYRVWVSDGHEELVRGAIFNELDARALRSDLVAAGNDPLVSNSLVPYSIIGPSVLFDELEVKRADSTKDKLPDYPAPPLTASAH